MERRRSLHFLLRCWYILDATRPWLEEVDQVGYTEGIAVRSGGGNGTPPRPGQAARVSGFILEAVDPSVDASRLAGSRRHGVRLLFTRV